MTRSTEGRGAQQRPSKPPVLTMKRSQSSPRVSSILKPSPPGSGASGGRAGGSSGIPRRRTGEPVEPRKSVTISQTNGWVPQAPNHQLGSHPGMVLVTSRVWRFFGRGPGWARGRPPSTTTSRTYTAQTRRSRPKFIKGPAWRHEEDYSGGHASRLTSNNDMGHCENKGLCKVAIYLNLEGNVWRKAKAGFAYADNDCYSYKALARLFS